MEVVLDLREEGVAVVCDGQLSHVFSFGQLAQPAEGGA